LFPVVSCQDSGTDSNPVALVRYAQSREVMGTFAEVMAFAADPDTAKKAVEAAYDRLADVNRRMSDYSDDSEIGRLNRQPAGEETVVSPETFFVLQKAMEVAKASGGAFDPTCRPLVQRWKHAGKENRLPEPHAIAATMQHVGWQKVTLDSHDRSVAVSVEGVQVDLGGIAKGYALDLAAAALKEAGAQSGLVNVGGDVIALGSQSGGRPWRIGMKHPFQPGLFRTLAVCDRAVATSGVQQRFQVIDGKRYSHIVDPRTGQPAEQAPAVTVIAPDGLTADAWATVFSVLTVEEGRAMIESLPEIEAMWIWGSADAVQTAESSGFAPYVAAD
jgi:thiamine biosynthesis lipoprotein